MLTIGSISLAGYIKFLIMKTFITLLSSSIFLFVACNQNKPTASTEATTQDSAKNVKECYQATVKTDSASLSF
jgi:hypothetical protein